MKKLSDSLFLLGFTGESGLIRNGRFFAGFFTGLALASLVPLIYGKGKRPNSHEESLLLPPPSLANTDSSTTSEPQNSTSPSSNTYSVLPGGRIDLTQFQHRGNHRYSRIGGPLSFVSNRHDECFTSNNVAQSTEKASEKSTSEPSVSSPLDGKEYGNWEMPRVVVSAIILLRGEGLSVGQISKTTGLGARSISRFLCDCATSQKES